MELHTVKSEERLNLFNDQEKKKKVDRLKCLIATVDLVYFCTYIHSLNNHCLL